MHFSFGTEISVYVDQIVGGRQCYSKYFYRFIGFNNIAIFSQLVFSFPFFFLQNYNLSALTIIFFCLNQLRADSDSCSKFFKSPAKVLQVAKMALSLEKLSKFDFLMHKNKSFKNMLKRIGPNIEPCGTADKMYCNALKMLFILTFCFRLFEYEFRKVTVSQFSP